MKKLNVLLILLAILTVAALTACNSGDTPDSTDSTSTVVDEVTEAPADSVTEVPTEVPTEAPTEAPTETPTEPATEAPTEPEPQPTVEITDGMMLYYEDFSGYGDMDNLDDTIGALGWIIQTTADDYAYSDWTADLAIKDGALMVNNYRPEEGFKGEDSYALMLGEDYMEAINEYGDYTIQYDVTYFDASNYKRYICLLTDYYGDTYNSYHFRIGGYANNQGHTFGKWVTYDVQDIAEDLASNLTANDPSLGTTIAYKLLGIETEIKDAAAIENFRNVTVTIRIQHDRDLGNIIYMKTEDMPEFICVSMPRYDAAGATEWENITGVGGLAFKIGAAINGSMDNIAMWAGLGEMPKDTTVTYPLAK
ncbi:MAG: PT domain-containing protein [Clostridia bacterium]|nr:PT domain-containing protein [Clostridia bacterium]